ncbi:MAG: carbon-nitrogen hydrolase family protein [Spirochaetes bacterium]|nr:carbon-nitrogen hydrolase family protein [Spirochaetota bacterium]
MKKFKVALMQKKLGTAIRRADADKLREFRPHFICFPEYFFTNKRLDTKNQTAHNFTRENQRLEILSGSLNCVVIGGTMAEYRNSRMYNTCIIYEKGKLLGSYSKQNLYFAEEGIITPGESIKVFSAYGIKFGILICADVFLEQYFIKLKDMGAKLIFIPTFSPRRQETPEEKFKRDNDIFVRGAKTADTVIVKVCSVRSEFRTELQGRSLIADRNGIIFRVMPEQEDDEIIILREITI